MLKFLACTYKYIFFNLRYEVSTYQIHAQIIIRSRSEKQFCSNCDFKFLFGNRNVLGFVLKNGLFTEIVIRGNK